jgi:hypothetical protein
MTIEEYKKLLDKHDWYYYNSDSLKVFEKGESAEKNLLKLAKDNKEFTQAFFEAKSNNK